MVMNTTETDRREAAALKAIYQSKKKELGITYEDLEQLLGVSYGAVGHLMTGKLRFNLNKALLMCDLFGCKLEDFSPRLAGEWGRLLQLAQTQSQSQSQQDTVPLIEIKDAGEEDPPIISLMSKPTPDFIGFLITVTDAMMDDNSYSAIQEGVTASISTQHIDIKDGKKYLLTSPHWPTPIIREARNIGGRWKLITKNEKLGIDTEWLDLDVHQIIGQVTGTIKRVNL